MALTIEIEWNGAYYYITVKRGKKYCTTDISRSKSLHGAFTEAERLVKRARKESGGRTCLKTLNSTLWKNRSLWSDNTRNKTRTNSRINKVGCLGEWMAVRKTRR